MKNSKFSCQDWGLFLIRLGLAYVFIAHGIQKFIGIDGTIAFFGKLGMPAFMAYVVAGLELLTGIAMLLGAYTRYAGMIIAIIMVVAIATAKRSAGLIGSQFEIALLLSAIGIAMTGPGMISLCRGACACCCKKDCSHASAAEVKQGCGGCGGACMCGTKK